VRDDLDPPSFQFGVPRGRGDSQSSEEASEEKSVEGPEAGGPPEHPPRKQGPLTALRSETLKRVVWAVPLAVFAIFLIVVGGETFALLMAVFGLLGLRELFRMASSLRPLEWPAYICLIGMVTAALYSGTGGVLIAFVAVLPLCFAAAAMRSDRRDITASIAVCILGLAWMGMAFAHAVLLREVPDHGAALLFDVLVATFLADTLGYAGGRLFGSKKLAPEISPNKTVEGLVAGFIGGTLGFWLAGLYQDWLPGIDALAMGAIIAMVAPVGDLFASLLKRDLAAKDTGSLFGPHGGVLDRLDAVLFTVIVGYYLVKLFGF
jgi:phosphatidate cytidylyltransferase